MATSGRSWRGRRGGFRGGRRGPPRRPPREYSTPEDLGSRKIELEDKSILIEAKLNEQGRFLKIQESNDRKQGKVIFSMETAQKFRPILESLIAEIKQLSPPEENMAAEVIKSELLTQGRRRFFIDLRQNPRGRFLKLTQTARDAKSFVTIPVEVCEKFQENIFALLDDHGETSPPSSSLPVPQEVRAGGKSFFFDVSRNDRGVYVRVSEVLRNSGRRTYINIPNSCWSQISEVFSNLHQEMPYDDDVSPSASGSEDNN